MLIGLGHVARTGKDSVAAILVEHHGFTRVAFADALKQLVYETNADARRLVDTFGWENAKTSFPDRVRQPLIDVGNAARRIIGEDVWIRGAAQKIEHRPDRDYVITDVRYPNEVDWVQSYAVHSGYHYGYAVRVDRPGVEPLPNVADQALVGWDGWDAVIQNDSSLSDLKVKVDDLLQSIRAKEAL